jgi:UDP-3-O-[3-hydroxymyristoyl] N-acetylglucosamine deacetylase
MEEMNSSVWNDYSSYRVQKTLTRAVRLNGIGLHTGNSTTLIIEPAEPNSGIVFQKQNGPVSYTMPASFKNVFSTALATSLWTGDTASTVSTVEHLMSALYAIGVTNAKVVVEGNEIPILDGSAGPFVDALLDAGVVAQAFTAPFIRVLKPIRIVEHGVICELLPRDQLRLTTSIDFDHPAIGLQTFALELTPQKFIDEVSTSRTFGFSKDVDTLRSKNLALGASLENVLAFDDHKVLNPEGARFPDECVRHKLLDALGDLALAGARIDGELVSFRGGHSIHISLLNSLAKLPTHWEWIPAERLGQNWPREATSQAPALTWEK